MEWEGNLRPAAAKANAVRALTIAGFSRQVFRGAKSTAALFEDRLRGASTAGVPGCGQREDDYDEGESRRGPLTHVAVGLLEGLAETR